MLFLLFFQFSMHMHMHSRLRLLIVLVILYTLYVQLLAYAVETRCGSRRWRATTTTACRRAWHDVATVRVHTHMRDPTPTPSKRLTRERSSRGQWRQRVGCGWLRHLPRPLGATSVAEALDAVVEGVDRLVEHLARG